MLSQEIIADLLRNYQGMIRRINEIENITKILGYCSGGEVFYIPEEVCDVLRFAGNVSEIDKLRKIVSLVEKMILSLDEKSRVVIEMLYVQGNTYDKTSEILDISRATVSNRRQKAIGIMSRMI